MRRPHEPNTIAAGLFSAWHGEDSASAALSLVQNRAEKIDKLRLGGHVDLAQNNADSLVHDVCEHIANGGISARLAQELANIAICARDRCYRFQGWRWFDRNRAK